MRLKHVKGAEETVASHPSVIHEPEKNLGQWKELRDGERAAELIAAGEKVSIAGTRCGFSDFSTFYRNFKKYKEISPAEFAKKSRPAE